MKCFLPLLPSQDGLDDWLHLVRLSMYSRELRSQGYSTLKQMCDICVEDLEDVGIFKLGHQKRSVRKTICIYSPSHKLTLNMKIIALNSAVPPERTRLR